MRKRTIVGTLAGVFVLCLLGGAWWWSERPPSVIHQQKPSYTEAAMDAGIQGEVWMECVVQTTGLCRDIQVVKSLDPTGLDLQAVNALRQWRFSPGTRFGRPVPVRVDIAFAYELR